MSQVHRRSSRSPTPADPSCLRAARPHARDDRIALWYRFERKLDLIMLTFAGIAVVILIVLHFQ